jgi:hypothetical protein
MTRRVRKLLRSPRIILGELGALSLLCCLGASIPQVGTATNAELQRLHEAGALANRLVGPLGLDHIFRTPLFLAAVLLASGSLVVVIVEQLKRLRLQWGAKLTQAHFQSAPFRAEFETGPSMRGDSCNGGVGSVKTWTENRVGLLGSPLFHLGLLLLMAAGALRALFGASAVVDLLEGESLAPSSGAWTGQFPGLVAKPFSLNAPITLHAVRATRFEDGDLRELKVELAFPSSNGTELEGGATETLTRPRLNDSAIKPLAINHDLKIGESRVFLGSDFGPAPLIEWGQGEGTPKRQAVLMRDQGAGRFEGELDGPGGETAFFRAFIGREGARANAVEVRVMKGSALLYTGDVEVGQGIHLADGSKLMLRGAPFWARLHGDRDLALWLAYASFAMMFVGVVLIFTVIKVDYCVVVAPKGDSNPVFVALKPQRLAPLFQERFENLVRQQKAIGGLLETAPCNRSALPAASQRPPTGRAFAQQAFLALLAVLAFSGCGPSDSERARELVSRYNQMVSEAYRRGDVRLAEPIVGPEEYKKLTGLIGVRLDVGVTLDSHLDFLEVTAVEVAGDSMRVKTKENWTYRDRKIGSGEEVGEASKDSYEMLYIFKKINKAWLVDEISFASAPKVGRTKLLFPNERPANEMVKKQEAKL